MSSSLNKIHVSNSTGLSLNERFTAITSQPKVHITNVRGGQSRSRSRSVQRTIPANVERVSSRANHRLLAQLQRKHKMQAALKLKRRSMRTVGGATNGNAGPNGRIQRGSVKAFRVAANGKPIKANSLTNIATMKADRELLNKQRRPLRRSNSSGNLANRLGPRRPAVGGAAQRVAKRNLDRQRAGVAGGRRNSGAAGGGRLLARDGINGGRSAALSNRGRSRSRSRTRTQPLNSGPNRSRPRNPETQQNVNIRGRSRSRNRNDANVPVNNNRRGRSLSRGRNGVANKSALPIKARLGVRPGANNVRTAGNRGAPQNSRRPNDNRRNASLTRRGVQSGRVQKRRNSTTQNIARTAVGGDINGRNRLRSRSAVRNANVGGGVQPRSRSRTRKGQVGQQRQQKGAAPVRQARQARQQQTQQQRNNYRAPRGRSQQRRGGNNNVRKGAVANNNGKAQTQQRRGRSRSRTGRGAIGGQRNQGNKPTSVNKDDLDKELDQYMATTKTENDMDYLLKN